MMRALLTAAFVVLTTGPLSLGCNEADSAIDCASICERYRDCVNDDYDVEECAERCQDSAENDREFRNDADECHACTDDRSCSGAVFNCLGECASIVP
jgi:hypothetical protein